MEMLLPCLGSCTRCRDDSESQDLGGHWFCSDAGSRVGGLFGLVGRDSSVSQNLSEKYSLPRWKLEVHSIF